MSVLGAQGSGPAHLASPFAPRVFSGKILDPRANAIAAAYGKAARRPRRNDDPAPAMSVLVHLSDRETSKGVPALTFHKYFDPNLGWD